MSAPLRGVRCLDNPLSRGYAINNRSRRQPDRICRSSLHSGAKTERNRSTAATTKELQDTCSSDTAANRLIASKALEKLPFQPGIIEAEDGFKALDMVKTEKPGLILLDLMMPGMNGFEVCRKIRENVETAFIPIIMLTASASEERRVEGYLIGTDDYMTKPFAVPDSHARVTRAFRRTYGV